MRIPVDVFAKVLMAWVIFVTTIVTFLNRNTNNPFYQIGPNEHLKIFYLTIDTPFKYTLIATYTLVSTILRTLQQEITSPWIIQSVQNHHEKTDYTKRHAYEVIIVDGIYRWFDWYMYMNILLAQIDMMLIEMLGNLLISYLTTKYIYLAHRRNATIILSHSAGIV
jgi:hypothetical protein